MIKKLLMVPRCDNCRHYNENAIGPDFATCRKRTTKGVAGYEWIKFPYADLERAAWTGHCGYFGKYFEDK